MPRLIHIIASNRWRGKERYTLDVCREFAHRGWSVTAYTRDAKTVDNFFTEQGIDLRHVPMRGVWDFYSIRCLTKDLRHETQDTIVHVHSYRDAFIVLVARHLARRPDIKVVVSRHKVKRALNTWLFRRIYKRVDRHIFVSEIAKTRFLSSWRRTRCPIPEERMHVLFNSIYIPDVEIGEEPEKGPKVGMFHGPLIPGKGVETLIDALPRLKGKRVRILIVGGGDPDYVDKLRRRAIVRGVMEMIDWKKLTEDPHTLIESCHFGIQPSVELEAFGMSNIEYMAHGRPVVCSNNGAQPEYITDGVEGYLVPPADASALGEAILRMATDDDERRRMGAAALQRFQSTLSWPHFTSRLQEIYTFPED